jgi:hypothetical protein
LVLTLGLGSIAATGPRVPPCQVDYPLLRDCVVVRGLVGSEKVDFFQDPDVVKAFRRHGLIVEVESAGSRAMACRRDLLRYSFAFPSSPWAADELLRSAAKQRPRLRSAAAVEVFESPIVVVTFDQVVEKLREQGVVSADRAHFRLERYLNQIFWPGKRWRDVALGPPFPTFGQVVVMSTRLDTSNSAELYLALVSQAVSGQELRSGTVADQVRPKVAQLFRAQGSTGLSSEEPFDQYLSPAGYELPLQVAYEAQFLSADFASELEDHLTLPDGSEVTLKRRMLYPDPGIVSVHAVAPLDTWGRQVAEALANDPRLRRLAAKHGFRPKGDAETFADVVGELATSQPPAEATGTNVTVPPGPLWDDFVNAVVDDVYGKDRAGVECG